MSTRPRSQLDSWMGTSSFWEMVKYSRQKFFSEPRQVVLGLVEIILSVGIGAAIALYLDPDWNVVPFPWNGVAFLILVGAALWIHRLTRPYRVARKLKQKRERNRIYNIIK